MRRALLLGLPLAASITLLAADLFGSLGWEQAKFEDTCFAFAKEPTKLPRFPVTNAMRVLALTQRKAAIESIGAKAKTYYASSTFQKRWADYVNPLYAKVQQEAADLAQGKVAKSEAIQQLEAVLPMLPPAQQKQVKAQIAEAMAQELKRKQKQPSTVELPPKDPKAAIKQALQTVLAATEGVDYAAALGQRESTRYFTNHAYESKPETWKMAFRAGREATEGARTFAKNWLTELK
jgi:seryl-tRNA synthetase